MSYLLSYPSHPERWIGLGFVSTIENAPPEVLAEIDGITAVAAQVVWGTTPQKPALMRGYLEECVESLLVPVGWGWCNATDPRGAQLEGRAHAEVVLDLGLDLYIANMEEPYDAHGDSSSVKFHLPDDYLGAFRQLAPDVELAVTTTPRWASNHAGLRAAGAVYMPQAFPLENGASVESCSSFAISWGWEPRYLRPLCQVYETDGKVPEADPFLAESAELEVGLVPYILEQALGGQGRELLRALEPAIIRPPAPGNGAPPPMEKIGAQHGITASLNRLRTLDPEGTLLEADAAGKWPPLSELAEIPLDKWRAYDKLERTLSILAHDHDAAITLSSSITTTTGPVSISGSGE